MPAPEPHPRHPDEPNGPEDQALEDRALADRDPDEPEPEDRDDDREGRDDRNHPHDREGDDAARAEHLAEEVARANPDPVTRREAIEQELAEEGVSDEGERLGRHNR